MDQGPVKPPPTPRWSLRDVADLARAVVVTWVAAIVLVAMMALIWSGVSDQSIGEVLTPSAIIVAALLPMFGVLSRFVDATTKGWTDTATIGRQDSFFGDQETAGLTTIGVFLFVSVPLALVGAVAFD